MNMDELLEAKLIECLDALEAGESAEQVLERYPEAAEALQPLLALAGALPELRQRPSQIAQARSRRLFLAQAGAAVRTRRPAVGGIMRLMSVAAAAAVLVVAVGAGLLALSSPALPGDTLYPAKRSFETVRLLLAPAGERQNVERELKQVRTREIEALLAGGREAQVALEGELQAIQPGEWLVAGIPVRVDASTVVEGSPQLGQDVRVEGVTRGGAIQATLIRAIGDAAAQQPTVTAPPTLGASSARATSTPAASPTATLRPATATPSATLVPATPQPTTPPPAPTATPDDDDDDDDDDSSGHDDDDSGSDNSGSGKDDDDDD